MSKRRTEVEDGGSLLGELPEKKAKTPARMLIPLSDKAERMVRDTATALGSTLSRIQVEVASRTLDGKLLLDGLVEAVCRELVKEHQQAMDAIFEAPADNGGALDPSGKPEA